MKIEWRIHKWNRRTDRATAWAPVGAKKPIYLSSGNTSCSRKQSWAVLWSFPSSISSRYRPRFQGPNWSYNVLKVSRLSLQCTDLMVPSPTPFWPASNSSRSLKLLGITKEGQVTRWFLYYINQIPTCPCSSSVRCHVILKSDRSLVKRITLKILLVATFSFTSDFTELMAGSCGLQPKLMKMKSKQCQWWIGRPLTRAIFKIDRGGGR